MRKSDYLKQQSAASKPVILNAEYLPDIKKEWQKYGYDPNYLLDTTNDFYNILEDYHLGKREVRALSPAFREDYLFMLDEDAFTYRLLFNRAKNYFCGFYNVRKRKYFSRDEVAVYATWHLDNIGNSRGRYMTGIEEGTSSYKYFENLYDTIHGKFVSLMCNISALLIAIDVTEYLDSRKMYHANITKSNVEKFLRLGFHAGEIFDPTEMRYRKPKDFDEYAYYIHTDFWFSDPSKGYKPDATYKWDKDIPSLKQLTR